MGIGASLAKWGLPLLVLAVVIGAPGGAGGDEPSPCDYKAFGLDAEKFFVYLTKDTPYRRWRHWPDRGISRPTQGPHGPLVVTYVNPAAYEAIVRKETLAFGSLIVMENRDADDRIRSLSVRIKIKGYNPEGGDWYWFAFAPDGTATAEGRAGACLGCHGMGKADDYVMGSRTK